MNHDGVIDYSEFQRWYYSGMKSYSDTKRSLYRAMNGFAQFTSAAADPSVLQFAQEHPNTITQSVTLGFNAPEAPKTRFHTRFMMSGPDYYQHLEKAKAHR